MHSEVKTAADQISGVQQFISSFLDSSRITLHSDESELKRLPKTGAGIAVVNRLFGSADPLLIIQAISKIRPDVVVIMPYIDNDYTQLEHYIISYNPEDSEEAITASFQNLIDHGLFVVIFPAKRGRISKITANMALDKRWHPKLMRVLFQLNAPVQPIHLSSESPPSLFHSKNFSFDGMIAFFQDLNRMEKQVHIRIGKSINAELKQTFTNPENFARYLRARLYALDNSIDVNSFFTTLRIGRKKSAKETIATATEANIIEQELIALDSSCLLLQQAEYTIYLAAARNIPKTLNEIGRLREITFRQAGEGTGHALDLDEYDMYYHQLILWDRENKQIAGGYRIGFGKEIMQLYGKRGFYLRSLFKFKKEFNTIFKQAIELGRSYIIPDYQKERLPLFLLWKGILSVLLQHPEYRYLIGPVSISNEYSSFSRQLIVGFIKKHYWNNEFAQYVKPRKAFTPLARDMDVEAIVEQLSPDMRELDKIIEEIEPQHFRLPVLVKKYIKQEAKIIGFNVDPSFENALDGLIILDIMDIPADTIENLKKDMH